MDGVSWLAKLDPNDGPLNREGLAMVSERFRELILKTDQALWFVESDLQQALAAAGPVESLIVLDLIAETAKIKNRVKSLQEAIK
jgi:hypothetical protein